MNVMTSRNYQSKNEASSTSRINFVLPAVVQSVENILQRIVQKDESAMYVKVGIQQVYMGSNSNKKAERTTRNLKGNLRKKNHSKAIALE